MADCLNVRSNSTHNLFAIRWGSLMHSITYPLGHRMWFCLANQSVISLTFYLWWDEMCKKEFRSTYILPKMTQEIRYDNCWKMHDWQTVDNIRFDGLLLTQLQFHSLPISWHQMRDDEIACEKKNAVSLTAGYGYGMRLLGKRKKVVSLTDCWSWDEICVIRLPGKRKNRVSLTDCWS